MIKYWKVEIKYCFDRICDKTIHKFETKEEAYKYYNANKDKVGEYSKMKEPIQDKILFEGEELTATIEMYEINPQTKEEKLLKTEKVNYFGTDIKLCKYDKEDIEFATKYYKDQMANSRYWKPWRNDMRYVMYINNEKVIDMVVKKG